MRLRYSNNHLDDVAWEDERIERGYPVIVQEEWPVDGVDASDPILRRTSAGVDSLLFEEDEVLVWAIYNRSTVTVNAASHSSAKSREMISKLKKRWPNSDRSEQGLIPVYFWSRGADGHPRTVRRKIMVPPWEEIESNYPTQVRQKLVHLIRDYEADAEGGKLILWTGKPGTGKSYALRALAREWFDWCDIQYVVDPEAFFTGSVDYFFSVAMNEGWGEEQSEERWKLIVLEDTGELLSADAKERSGNALGRFLNVCDGLVGQGLRIQILVTTNEEIKTFHPAVTRPGRTADQIQFDAFSREEAVQWMERDDIPDTTYFTLADLYALQRGESLGSLSRSAAGFVKV